jgi:hypothetical protein
MQTAILSCEFLMSPASADESVILEQIESLIEIKQLISSGDVAPILEDDALGKLTERSMYPSDGIFKGNMSRCNVAAFSSKDVTTAVNAILTHGSSCASTIPERLLEWTSRLFDPVFSKIPFDRKLELEELLERTATANRIDQLDLGVLFHCAINKFSTVDVRGTITSAYPETGLPLPFDFDEPVSIYRSYKQYLASMDYHSIFDRVTAARDLRFCFYAGGLNKLKSKGQPLSNLSLNQIYIGTNFFESLKLNQSLPYQNFSYVTLDTVVDVLASYKVEQLTVFETSAGSGEARRRGSCTAFRVHVTKSAVALRLMFWVDDEGNIELANVGPKNELKICGPDYL